MSSQNLRQEFVSMGWTAERVIARYSHCLKVISATTHRPGQKSVRSAWHPDAGSGFTSFADLVEFMGVERTSAEYQALALNSHLEGAGNHKSRQSFSSEEIAMADEAMGWSLAYLSQEQERLRDAFAIYTYCKAFHIKITEHLDDRFTKALVAAREGQKRHAANIKKIQDDTWEFYRGKYQELFDRADNDAVRDIIKTKVVHEYSSELLRLKAVNDTLHPHMTTDLCIDRDAVRYAANKAAKIIATNLTKKKVMVR